MHRMASCIWGGKYIDGAPACCVLNCLGRLISQLSHLSTSLAYRKLIYLHII